jgi:FMN phosphatase YigB (HAD superfamily)
VPLASPFGPEAIDWVFLDAYSTIFHEDYALLAEACIDMARSARGHESAGEIGAWWEERFHALCDAANTDRFVVQREIVTRSLAETVRHFRCETDLSAWLSSIFTYAGRPVIHHDTRAFLAGVGVPVCIVSNIDEHDFADAAAFTELTFGHIVTSEGALSYKPDGGIFREALRRTGADRSRVLHVGDSFHADVEGAVGAGLHVAWLNRKGKPQPEQASVTPDVEVRSLLDLLEA